MNALLQANCVYETTLFTETVIKVSKRRGKADLCQCGAGPHPSYKQEPQSCLVCEIGRVNGLFVLYLQVYG